jgi:hypothetical protein
VSGEFLEERGEVAPCEAPLERLGSRLVVILEGEQPVPESAAAVADLDRMPECPVPEGSTVMAELRRCCRSCEEALAEAD